VALEPYGAPAQGRSRESSRPSLIPHSVLASDFVRLSSRSLEAFIARKSEPGLAHLRSRSWASSNSCRLRYSTRWPSPPQGIEGREVVGRFQPIGLSAASGISMAYPTSVGGMTPSWWTMNHDVRAAYPSPGRKHPSGYRAPGNARRLSSAFGSLHADESLRTNQDWTERARSDPRDLTAQR
jgi:hypothetical protein